MLFAAPELDDREQAVLREIGETKELLRWQLHEPRRWDGSLRRLSFARNIQASNSIEGYDAALDDAAAVALGEEPLDADEETRLALEGYRDAMTFVLQLADDDQFGFSDQLIKSLHFMMTKYALSNRPGQWRRGPVYVRREVDGVIVYEGAEAHDIPKLMQELVAGLNEQVAHDEESVVCAAMAHLNLVMVHPFKDGNGRMARCLQSLALARRGVLTPVFMSVEEYLGRNTQRYYDVLAEVGQGSWGAGNDARPWVRFMLTAHLRQAKTLLNRTRETEKLWVALDRLASRKQLPERAVFAMYDAAYGFRVRNGTYRAVFEDSPEQITEQTASSDLRKMVAADLIIPQGEKRGRFYVAGPELKIIMADIRGDRSQRDDTDPFAA